MATTLLPRAGGRQQRVLIGESTRVTCIIYTPAKFNYGSLTSQCFLKLYADVVARICTVARIVLRPTGNVFQSTVPGRVAIFFKPSGHSTSPRLCACSVARVRKFKSTRTTKSDVRLGAAKMAAVSGQKRFFTEILFAGNCRVYLKCLNKLKGFEI